MLRMCSAKVLVIGLDGATFDIIKPLAWKGKLPTINKLMKEGVYGELKSTIPPSSIPAWPSFMTGVNPGKHGCFDFMKRSSNEYYGKMITSRDIKTKTLWKILSDFNKRSIVINVTGTYPPEEINGIIISGLLTPRGKKFVYPSRLQKDIEKRGYQIFIKDEILSAPSTILYSELCRLEEKRAETATYLMKKYDWDFFMVMFLGTDTIQHKLWGNRKLIYQYYQKMDQIIRKILETIEENTYIFVMSDHGFGELRKVVHINEWLYRLNLLSYKRIDASSTREFKIRSLKGQKTSKFLLSLSKLGFTKENIIHAFDKFAFHDKLMDIIPKRIKNMLQRLPATNLDIDWPNTRVFLSSFFGTESQSIMINLKGREPQGIVSPCEYEKLRAYVINKLATLKDPDTGECVFERIFKKEEIYSGPYIENAPDIITLLKGGYKFSNSLNTKNIITKLRSIEGSHRLYGILIAHGPEINKNVMVKNARIIDLAPTILHIFNIEIPQYMDGFVLKKIFRPNSELAKRPVRYLNDTFKEKIRKRIKDSKRKRR